MLLVYKWKAVKGAALFQDELQMAMQNLLISVWTAISKDTKLLLCPNCFMEDPIQLHYKAASWKEENNMCITDWAMKFYIILDFFIILTNNSKAVKSTIWENDIYFPKVICSHSSLRPHARCRFKSPSISSTFISIFTIFWGKFRLLEVTD